MRRLERKLWANARTLADLGELTAQWLEGVIASQPGYEANCGPDPETEHLIPVLAQANRAGYVTCSSQSGVYPEEGYDGCLWQQRAAVQGFADGPLALALTEAAERAGLLVIADSAPKGGLRGRLARWFEQDGRIVVTATTDGREHTWFGARLSRSALGWLYDELSADGLRAITGAWQVTLIDPEWGRDDLLWDTLASVCGSAVSR